MKSFLKMSIVLGAIVAIAGEAQAIPSVGRMPSFVPESTATVSFDGILAIRELTGGCSAALVRYDLSRADDAAMVLTNGHCNETGFLDPGVFLSDRKSRRKFRVLDPRDGRRDIGSIVADKIIYATMTKTDITLYRVTETYAQIEKKFGIHPLTLAAVAATSGTKIEIASGYWRRGYACEIEAVIPTLNEGNWTWKTSLRYSRPGCETIGGTSGSPIVEAGTQTVVAINNTGNESGEKCTENNPCEVDRDGKITYERGLSYGQQTFWIYSCLDKNMNFDLKTPTCRLPGGAMAPSESILSR